jgi:hypothetical protein
MTCTAMFDPGAMPANRTLPSVNWRKRSTEPLVQCPILRQAAAVLNTFFAVKVGAEFHHDGSAVFSVFDQPVPSTME